MCEYDPDDMNRLFEYQVFLIAHGVNPNAIIDGETALTDAFKKIVKRNPQRVRVTEAGKRRFMGQAYASLRGAGADPSIANADGKNFFDLVRETYGEDVVTEVTGR
jgi:hypothetical protein